MPIENAGGDQLVLQAGASQCLPLASAAQLTPFFSGRPPRQELMVPLALWQTSALTRLYEI